MKDITLDRAALLRGGGALAATLFALAETACAQNARGKGNSGATPQPTGSALLTCCGPGDFTYSSTAKAPAPTHKGRVEPKPVHRVRIFLDESKKPSSNANEPINENNADFVYTIDLPSGSGHDEGGNSHAYGPIVNSSSKKPERLWVLIKV